MPTIKQIIVPTCGTWAGFLLGLDEAGNVWFQDRIQDNLYTWKKMEIIEEVEIDTSKEPLIK